MFTPFTVRFIETAEEFMRYGNKICLDEKTNRC